MSTTTLKYLGEMEPVPMAAIKALLHKDPLVKVAFDALQDELQKIALTRGVQEWRRANAAGDTAGASQIAQGYGQLGAKPRFLENISGGGMEAGVDKMMGKSQMGPSEDTSGLLARKIYKPDSPISTGANTTTLLQQKQEYTDAARGLSPQAKEMVPAMYGHQVIKSPLAPLLGNQAEQRHISEHEFVPGLRTLNDPQVSHEQTIGALKGVGKTVTDPMNIQGKRMGDVGFAGAKDSIHGNISNIGVTPSGQAKVVDFLPQGKGRVVQMDPRGVAVTPTVTDTGTGGTRMGTAYGKGNMNELRREVYRPNEGYKMPQLPGQLHPPVASPVDSSAVARLKANWPAFPAASSMLHSPVGAATGVATGVSHAAPSIIKSVASHLPGVGHLDDILWLFPYALGAA